MTDDEEEDDADEPEPEHRSWWQRKIIVMPAGLLLAIVFSGALRDQENTNRDGSAAAFKPPAEQGQAQEGARVGHVVKDGKLDIVVRGIRCGAKVPTAPPPKGIHCVANVSVRNTGNDTTTVSTDSWKLYANHTQFKSDAVASMEASKAGTGKFFTELDPGSSMNVKVVYDVPPGTKPTAISVLDGLYGDGIKVAF